MQDEAVSLYWSVLDMPTAIARAFTEQGFVIAADCRAYDDIAKEIKSDLVQKIFEVPGRPIACSVSGDSIFSYGNFEFDFVSTLRQIIEIPMLELDFANYATWLGDTLLNQMVRAGRPEISAGTPIRSDEIRSRISLDGYGPGNGPEQWALCFYPQRRSWFSFNRDSAWIGSTAITRVLKNPKDSRLLAYKRTEPSTLEEAKNSAITFIRAHTDPEAEAIDPDKFRSIGKQIHMATITPAEGFRWVAGFEPVSR
jgi:hypothetical protein